MASSIARVMLPFFIPSLLKTSSLNSFSRSSGRIIFVLLIVLFPLNQKSKLMGKDLTEIKKALKA